jgi:hypothetical protein
MKCFPENTTSANADFCWDVEIGKNFSEEKNPKDTFWFIKTSVATEFVIEIRNPRLWKTQTFTKI